MNDATSGTTGGATTHKRFADFVNACIAADGVDVQETNFRGDDYEYVTLENVNDANPATLARLFADANANGYDIHPLKPERYNGEITVSAW